MRAPPTRLTTLTFAALMALVIVLSTLGFRSALIGDVYCFAMGIVTGLLFQPPWAR